MKKFGYHDAVVQFDLAEAWLKDLLELPSKVLISRLLELEPAVIGIALNRASKVQLYLTYHGVSSEVAEEASDEVLRTGAICCELMRRGYGRFFDDLINPNIQASRSAIMSKEQNRRKVSAFGSAIRLIVADAEVGVNDVLAARPDWSREQAEKFLARCSGDISRAMAQAGEVELLRQLEGESHAE
jgi:hypothetical protein